MRYVKSRAQTAHREVIGSLLLLVPLTVTFTWLVLSKASDNLIVLTGSLAGLCLLTGFTAFLRRERLADGGRYAVSGEEKPLYFLILTGLAGFVSVATCGVYWAAEGGSERLAIVGCIAYGITAASVCIAVAIKLVPPAERST
jgi:hypothetical protein